MLFWNPSITRVALLPNAIQPDSFAVERARVAHDGSLLVDGAPARGNVLLSTPPGGVGLQDGTVIHSTSESLFVSAPGGVRLRYVIGGTYPDGWLAGGGSITVWPADGRLDGRLVLSLGAPRDGKTLKMWFDQAHARTVFARIAAGRSVEIAIPLCSRHPVTIEYRAEPTKFIPEGMVSGTLDAARFVPGGC